MPKQNSLTKRQMLFVDYIMKGELQTHAARLAGYAETSGGKQAHNLMKNPMIQAEIARRQKLQEEAMRKAFLYDSYKAQRLLSKIVDKEEAYDRDRIKAAEGILDRAGFRAIDTPQINTTTNNVLTGFSEEQLMAILKQSENN